MNTNKYKSKAEELARRVEALANSPAALVVPAGVRALLVEMARFQLAMAAEIDELRGVTVGK